MPAECRLPSEPAGRAATKVRFRGTLHSSGRSTTAPGPARNLACRHYCQDRSYWILALCSAGVEPNRLRSPLRTAPPEGLARDMCASADFPERPSPKRLSPSAVVARPQASTSQWRNSVQFISANYRARRRAHLQAVLLLPQVQRLTNYSPRRRRHLFTRRPPAPTQDARPRSRAAATASAHVSPGNARDPRRAIASSPALRSSLADNPLRGDTTPRE